MVYVTGFVKVTSTGTPVKIVEIPGNSIGYLKSLVVTNEAASTATVTIMSGDGSDTSNDYTIMVLKVPANSTIVLDRSDLEGFHSIKDVYAVVDQQPVDIAIVIDAL